MITWQIRTNRVVRRVVNCFRTCQLWESDLGEKTAQRNTPSKGKSQEVASKKPFYLQVRARPLHNTYNVGNDAKDRMQNLKLKIMAAALISILSTSKYYFYRSEVFQQADMNSVRLPANILENVQVRNKRICSCGCYRNFGFHVLGDKWKRSRNCRLQGKKALGLYAYSNC